MKLLTQPTIAFVLLLLIGACNKQVKNLTTSEFEAKIAEPEVQVLDVRTPEEFATGYLPNAVNINYYSEDFKAQTAGLNKNKPVAVYCKSGGRSTDASADLTALGFKEVYALDGGLLRWEYDGKKLVGAAPKKQVEGERMGPAAFDALIATDTLSLVDFYAVWCGPCKMMAPHIQQVRETMKGAVQVIKVDVDKDTELGSRYRIESLPTVAVFKNGKLLESVIGYQSYEQLIQLIERNTKNKI